MYISSLDKYISLDIIYNYPAPTYKCSVNISSFSFSEEAGVTTACGWSGENIKLWDLRPPSCGELEHSIQIAIDIV